MTINQNILFAAGDFIQGAAVYSSSSTIAGFGVENLQTEAMWKPARFSNALSSVTYDFGEQKGFNLISVLKHNMGQLAKWRVKIGDDPTFSVSAYDSGWVNVLPSSSGFGALAWGEFDWGGLSPLSFVRSYNRHAYLPLDQTYIGRYIQISLDDSVDAAARTDNYIQIARLWASSAYQPSLNVNYGAQSIPIDETGVKISRSGARQYNLRKVKRRAIKFEFPDLPHKEFLYNVFGPLYMNGGISQTVIVILFPLDEETWFAEALYGNFRATEALTHVYFGRVSNSGTVEESV